MLNNDTTIFFDENSTHLSHIYNQTPHLIMLKISHYQIY